MRILGDIALVIFVALVLAFFAGAIAAFLVMLWRAR